MPVKLYYNGSATLYREPSPDCLKNLLSPKHRTRDKTIIEHIYAEAKEQAMHTCIRKYHLKHHNRQQIISSGIYGHDNKHNNILFLTLTYPASKFTHNDPEKSSNQALKNFLNNLRTNYGLKGYVWVKELTKIGTPHYHMIIDLPYVDIRKLNDIWAHNAGIVSKCCVRSDPDHGLIVKTAEQAGFYVCKYITKIRDNCTFDKRVYTISNSWQIPPITIQDDTMIKDIIDHSQYSYQGKYASVLWIGRDYSKQIFQTLNG